MGAWLVNGIRRAASHSSRSHACVFLESSKALHLMRAICGRLASLRTDGCGHSRPGQRANNITSISAVSTLLQLWLCQLTGVIIQRRPRNLNSMHVTRTTAGPAALPGLPVELVTHGSMVLHMSCSLSKALNSSKFSLPSLSVSYSWSVLVTICAPQSSQVSEISERRKRAHVT